MTLYHGTNVKIDAIHRTQTRLPCGNLLLFIKKIWNIVHLISPFSQPSHVVTNVSLCLLFCYPLVSHTLGSGGKAVFPVFLAVRFTPNAYYMSYATVARLKLITVQSDIAKLWDACPPWAFWFTSAWQKPILEQNKRWNGRWMLEQGFSATDYEGINIMFFTTKSALVETTLTRLRLLCSMFDSQGSNA